jgi:hypothetical protein
MELELRPTPSGHDTLSLDGRLLHSSRDPRREAERAVKELVRREPPCVVLIGVGLGYRASAILENTESTYVIAFEPEDEILQLARAHTLQPDHPRLVLVSSVDELDQQLPLLAASGYETMTLQNRFTERNEELGEVNSVLDAFASRLEINQNTLSRFGRLWVKNLCRNIEFLADGTGVSSLRGLLTGTPALLLAAGPTLDEILPKLPRLARRMTVVAVDTAVSHARSVGVEPDIAVVVDPQYWNARHLDHVEGTSAILVAETAAHPVVFERFTAPYVFCSSVFPLGIRFERRLGSFGQLGAGGSVSTTAWDLIRLMGASTVFLAGLDLGFPGGRTHCSGSFFEELAVANGSSLSPAAQVIFRYIYGARPHPVSDYREGNLLSDARMDIYRAWFERRVRDECLPTYSLSAGSSRIPGVSVADLRSLEALPDLRPEIAQRFATFRKGHAKAIASNDHNDRSQRRRQIAEEADLLITELQQLATLAEHALDSVSELENIRRRGGDVDFSVLEQTDSDLLRSEGRSVASFLMQEAISTIQKGFGSGSIEEQLEASRLVYRSLSESISFHREQLEATRNRL